MQVEGTAEWRIQKAAEYPHDADRNLEAAKDLSALAKSLEEIPADDPLWADCERVSEAEAESDESDRMILLSEWLSDRLKDVDFRDACPEDGRAFLQEIIGKAREIAVDETV
jgi:hypothetical protein